MMPTISKNNQNLFPSFFNELNNLFNDQWLSTSMQHSIPAINVSEDAKEYKIEIAAPSTTKEDFNLSVNNGILSIRMEKKCDNKEVVAGNMLSGCGIAYIMRFLHAMMEGGVEMGLYPKDAQAIAMQAMKGAVAVLEGSDIHPAVAIDKVTTPGGLTIRGLNELDHAGFNDAVIRCLKAGLEKD